ncbi:MAG: glycosyltransferase family 4 protein [Gemmatimonadota bacterium]
MSHAPGSVVMVDPHLEGGVAHYTWALCDALARRGTDVTLLTRRGAAYELDALPRRFRLRRDLPGVISRPPPGVGQRLRSLVDPTHWDRHLAEILTDVAREHDSRLLHQQWQLRPPRDPHIWDAARQRRPGVRVIYTAHNVFPHDGSSDARASWSVAHAHPDRIVVHGERLRATGVRDAGMPSTRVDVVPLGNYHFLADAFAVPDRGEARTRLGLDADRAVVLFFGHVRPYKGLDVLLSALAELVRRGRDVTLLVAGRVEGGWSGSDLERQARSLGLGDAHLRVEDRFLPLEEIAPWFAASDLLCAPYHRGSQSGVLQLAYAYRRPVLATRVGSLAEVVLDGETGCTVEPGAPEALADGLDALLDDRAALARMGARAREWSADVFGWDRIADLTRAVYERALADGHGAGEAA